MSCIQAWSELVCNKRNTTKRYPSTGQISKRFQLVESNKDQTKNLVLRNLYRIVENDNHFTLHRTGCLIISYHIYIIEMTTYHTDLFLQYLDIVVQLINVVKQREVFIFYFNELAH